MSDEEKQMALMKIVRDRWDEIKHEIPEEKHAYYMREIAKELDIIFKIKHADYFLLNYEIIKDAVENRGGMITFSGRGCLTGDSLVSTIKGNIPLKFINVGDYVLSEDGNYHKVLDTMEYDVDENLVTIKYEDGEVTLTLDHKIKIFQNGFGNWKEAMFIKKGDYICTASFDFRGIETVVKVLGIEIHRKKTKVYDITVKDMHSYVANGIVVHNSGPSFYVNHLLGFTQIDRISSPITLYPERFLSTSRMTAGSLADIDFNCGNTPVFEGTQQDILGQEHAYPMIAYGKLKPKAAWKMYCRAVDVPFEVSNEISAKIDEYESDLKYWDAESGEEEPNVLDYIPEDLQDYFLKSKEFLGLIDHASRHPCGNLLLTQDIKEEVGIVRLKSKGGRETICACLDGLWCEKYLMLKNDLLTVTCVRLVYDLYKRVGLSYMSLNKLLEEVKIHPEVWDMYEKGYVVGLNQVERNSTKRKVMKYKPKNISELSAFIAGIRPAFKSLVDKLINREHFEYGIPTLDNLLQTEELPESFILYQEQIMKILAFAGIPMGDCYTVIKSISKKRFEKIMHYKEQFLTGMAQKLIEAENISESRSEDIAKTIWGIIEDASAYGFNSSHSLSVSFDSLLAAYFKALYPLEFYEVYLNLQMEKSKKDKAFLAQQEMKSNTHVII
jgi:DNA polymerase III alpha subunit